MNQKNTGENWRRKKLKKNNEIKYRNKIKEREKAHGEKLRFYIRKNKYKKKKKQFLNNLFM